MVYQVRKDQERSKKDFSHQSTHRGQCSRRWENKWAEGQINRLAGKGEYSIEWDEWAQECKKRTGYKFKKWPEQQKYAWKAQGAKNSHEFVETAEKRAWGQNSGNSEPEEIELWRNNKIRRPTERL